MTLHDLALKWVAEQTNGEILHGRGVSYPPFSGKFPDVIIRSKRGQIVELHEVEAVEIGKDKLDAYARKDFTMTRSCRLNRVLWIVLPNLGTGFHEVRFVQKSHRKGFETLGIVGVPRSYAVKSRNGKYWE